MELNLKTKSDTILLADLKAMVAKERQLLTQILHYLKEVYDRRLYLERGYSSLFAFCTEYLGYSESAAQRRIQAMRLLKEIPQVEEKIEKGILSLSVASQLQSFLRKEEKTAPMTPEEKLELIEEMEGTSARVCEKKLIQKAPEKALPKEKTRPISEEKTLIQFVADKILMSKIEKLKSLLSHQNVEGRYDRLFEKVIDMALEELEPRESKALPTSEVKSKGRYIPKAIRREVWVKAEGKCQYQDKQTGRVCGSTHKLEIEHLKPYAWGGGHQPDNLQLLCRNHNQHKAKKIFGEVKV